MRLTNGQKLSDLSGSFYLLSRFISSELVHKNVQIGELTVINAMQWDSSTYTRLREGHVC